MWPAPSPATCCLPLRAASGQRGVSPTIHCLQLARGAKGTLRVFPLPLQMRNPLLPQPLGLGVIVMVTCYLFFPLPGCERRPGGAHSGHCQQGSHTDHVLVTGCGEGPGWEWGTGSGSHRGCVDIEPCCMDIAPSTSLLLRLLVPTTGRPERQLPAHSLSSCPW